MVRVGSVCIDKYEASVWDAPTGGNQIIATQSTDYGCKPNGQDCKGKIFARSVPGVEPARFITWFQAQQALINSGKRLPTNAEWQRAVAGTPDPGDSPGPEDCNTSSGSSDPEPTGSRSACVSDWEVNDMVGNVWEWVADWDEEGLLCANWPEQFGSDLSCIGRAEGIESTRFPGALRRGGDFEDGTNAGPFAIIGTTQPSGALFFLGFRGAR